MLSTVFLIFFPYSRRIIHFHLLTILRRQRNIRGARIHAGHDSVRGAQADHAHRRPLPIEQAPTARALLRARSAPRQAVETSLAARAALYQLQLGPVRLETTKRHHKAVM